MPLFTEILRPSSINGIGVGIIFTIIIGHFAIYYQSVYCIFIGYLAMHLYMALSCNTLRNPR
jgi:hypothetical protein